MKIDNGVIILFMVGYFVLKNFTGDGLNIEALKKYLPNLNNAPSVVQVKGREVSEPSAELKASAQVVADVIAKSSTPRDKRADAIALGDFFGDFNKIILAQDGLVKTTQQVKDTFKQTGKGYIQTVGYTKNDYETLGDEVDRYLEKTLGLDNALLDKSKAVNAFAALQWTLYQVGK